MHSKTSNDQGISLMIESMSKHVSPTYFVLKKIAQDNLYGVDIMPEACEIARLRLFLKLMAVIDKPEEIEPLPDLEFNIKSGNLLMGVTRRDLADRYLTTFEGTTIIDDVASQSAHLAELWENFEISQEIGNPRGAKIAKDVLISGIRVLRPTLDKLVFESVKNTGSHQSLEAWSAAEHQFHWFLEFPQVFQEGGFDVVVGNPPYIAKDKVEHSTLGHDTSDCPDLYAMCMERSAQLVNSTGWYAMIVMHNLCFSDDYKSLRKVLKRELPERWISSYGRIPACLFTNETRVRNSIVIGKRSSECALHATRLHRWESDYRPHLMQTIQYSLVPSEKDSSDVWPFLGDTQLASVLWNSNGKVGMSTIEVRGIDAYATDADGFHQGRNVWALNFKLTAYNYMPVFVDIPTFR
jgi:hypothetical protein